MPKAKAAKHPKRGPVASFLRADPLTQIFDGIRLGCLIPSAHEMTAPWGVQFGWLEPKRMARHLHSIGVDIDARDLPTTQGEILAILRGHCCLEVPSCNIKLTLAGGDVVLLTRNDPYILRDKWETPARNVREVGSRENMEKRRGIQYGGGGELTTFLTGPFFFEDAEDHPLLASLPPVLHVRGDQSHVAPWLESTLKFMNSELTALLPGSLSIVNHLAHVLFIQAVRAYAAALPEQSPANWFGAVFDAQLAPALGAMHAKPEEPWTVATLAAQAGSSRSVFSARFTSLMGKPPLLYLTECRMRKAKGLLRETNTGVKSIAAKVGYSNESAFSNAFRRANGMSPGEYRRAKVARAGQA